MDKSILEKFEITEVHVRPDRRHHLAESPQIPEIYGFGDSSNEAYSNFLYELQELRDELIAEDDSKLSESWLKLKKKILKYENRSERNDGKQKNRNKGI